jgi:hypothetical protein
VGTIDGRVLLSEAAPSASTSALINPGIDPTPIGVEAMHLPSRQWLNTT